MSEIGVTGVLSRTLGMMGAYPVPALVSLVVLVTPSVLIDIAPNASSGPFNLFVSLLSVFAQYLVIARLLRREGLMSADGKAGRVGSFVGAGIVTGLAIALATLLLIVPGLYLWARWATVDPLIIGEGRTMGEAMRESSEETRPLLLPIMVALVLFFLPAVAWLLASAFYPELDPASLPISLAGNLLIFGAVVASWYCAVAVHRILHRPQTERLAEVFG